MSSTPQNRREWVESMQGSLKHPVRWHILPHELLFVMVMGVVWLRVGWSAGFSQSSAILFFLYTFFLVGAIIWCQLHPSPYRWRVRLGATLLLSALAYFSLSTAVPLMHNPSGLEAFNWHQDTALAQWDAVWLGDWPRRLMELAPAAWVTDVFMAWVLACGFDVSVVHEPRKALLSCVSRVTPCVASTVWRAAPCTLCGAPCPPRQARACV